MTVQVLNRIGGEQRPAADGACFERRNPADTGQVVSVAPESGRADVHAAVDAGLEAGRAWRDTAPSTRADILSTAGRVLAGRAAELGAELVAEEGKLLSDARMEASRSAKNLELYAGEALRLTGTTFPSDDDTLVWSTRDPVGVVGVITPWNFPLNMPSRKIGPALAAGNTVVFKPSPMTPLMGERLADALTEAGLPAGVLNVVHGSAAGALVVADERVRAVTFTGSLATGRKIHAAMGLGRRVQLELGGKNPVVVLADADLDGAATVVARSSFNLSGQACTGAGRILVADEVHDGLVERVAALAAGYVLGPGDRDGVTMGPLVDEHSLVAMERAVAQAVADDAQVVCGGQRAIEDDLALGCYFPPTILIDVEPGTELSRDEVFGPVIGFERVSDLDHAIASANAVEYGLAAAICTRSMVAARRFCAEVEAGMVRVNRPTVGAAINAPFGGVKLSGTGVHKEQLGPTVMDFYTQSRTIWLGT